MNKSKKASKKTTKTVTKNSLNPRKSIKKFAVSQEQLDKVAKILGTNHFYLFAHNPATISTKGVFDGTSATQQLRASHLLILSKQLSQEAFEKDPQGASLAALAIMSQSAAFNASKKKTR